MQDKGVTVACGESCELLMVGILGDVLGSAVCVRSRLFSEAMGVTVV